MGEDLVTTLSMENGVGGGHHGPCTHLSMDPSGHLAAPDDRAVARSGPAATGSGHRDPGSGLAGATTAPPAASPSDSSSRTRLT